MYKLKFESFSWYSTVKTGYNFRGSVQLWSSVGTVQLKPDLPPRTVVAPVTIRVLNLSYFDAYFKKNNSPFIQIYKNGRDLVHCTAFHEN